MAPMVRRQRLQRAAHLPYSYLWSNGATTGTLVGLTAGTYTVTVTDDEGCTISSIGGVSNTGGPVITVVDTKQCIVFWGSVMVV